MNSNGQTCDFSDVQCSLCKPITLGQCGHPFFFADDDWMQEQARQKFRDLGRKCAEGHQENMLSRILLDLRSERELAAFAKES